MKKNRRQLIKALGMGAAGTLLPSTSAKSKHIQLPADSMISDGDPIGIGLIGAGGMGFEDCNTALRHNNIKLQAVCDLYDGRLDLAQKTWGSDYMITKNYQDVLKRKDIDAVIIATPDHWHKQISIDALRAGKHVYCEKPMVHSINEGYEVIDAWKKSGKVFIVGSQGLSSIGNVTAKKFLSEGMLGDITYAEGFWARFSPIGAWQYTIPADASPSTVDWNRFISNSTKRDFDAKRFFRWRNYRDYGTGMSGDLFVHLFSSLHFITDSLGPNQINAMGGLRYWKDGREVPDILIGNFNYPTTKEHSGFNLSLRCNFVDGTSGTTYLKISGTKGSMDVQWDKIIVRMNKATDNMDPFAMAKLGEAGIQNAAEMTPTEEVTYTVSGDYKGTHYQHFQNWFDAIRNNGTVVEDPIFGFRAAAPALLCNDSYFRNKQIEWDPKNLKIV